MRTGSFTMLAIFAWNFLETLTLIQTINAGNFRGMESHLLNVRLSPYNFISGFYIHWRCQTPEMGRTKRNYSHLRCRPISIHFPIFIKFLLFFLRSRFQSNPFSVCFKHLHLIRKFIYSHFDHRHSCFFFEEFAHWIIPWLQFLSLGKTNRSLFYANFVA